MTCRFPFAIMLYPFCKHRKKFRLYRNISTTPVRDGAMAARKDTHSRGLLKRGHGGHTTREKKPLLQYSGVGPVHQRHLHGALNTDAYEPPIHGVRGDEAANHADLHHEPKNGLIGRHGAYQKEHSYGHPAVHPHLPSRKRQEVNLESSEPEGKPPVMAHRGQSGILEENADDQGQHIIHRPFPIQ